MIMSVRAPSHLNSTVKALTEHLLDQTRTIPVRKGEPDVPERPGIYAIQPIARLGARGEVARDLGYRLYGICERRNWAEEARAYNGLVVAWPEISRLAAQTRPSGPAEPELVL